MTMKLTDYKIRPDNFAVIEWFKGHVVIEITEDKLGRTETIIAENKQDALLGNIKKGDIVLIKQYTERNTARLCEVFDATENYVGVRPINDPLADPVLYPKTKILCVFNRVPLHPKETNITGETFELSEIEIATNLLSRMEFEISEGENLDNLQPLIMSLYAARSKQKHFHDCHYLLQNAVKQTIAFLTTRGFYVDLSGEHNDDWRISRLTQNGHPW